MRKGGRYRFWIPFALAQGAAGVPGAIPPNAELEFIVTVIDVKPAAEAPPASLQVDNIDPFPPFRMRWLALRRSYYLAELLNYQHSEEKPDFIRRSVPVGIA
jgi:hypothetical protein